VKARLEEEKKEAQGEVEEDVWGGSDEEVRIAQALQWSLFLILCL
jgi:hypothetical protein